MDLLSSREDDEAEIFRRLLSETSSPKSPSFSDRSPSPMVSPFRKLPTELTSMILLWAVDITMLDVIQNMYTYEKSLKPSQRGRTDLMEWGGNRQPYTGAKHLLFLAGVDPATRKYVKSEIARELREVTQIREDHDKKNAARRWTIRDHTIFRWWRMLRCLHNLLNPGNWWQASGSLTGS